MRIRFSLTKVLIERLFSYCPHQIHDGINIYCWWDLKEKDVFFRRVVDALETLRTHDLRHYQRVKRYVKNIALFAFAFSNDYYQRATSTIMLREFKDLSPGSLAVIFVHEATHGFLAYKGIRYEVDKCRHETLCSLEEIRAARKLIDRLNQELPREKREEMIAAYEASVQKALQSKWWEGRNRIRNRLHRLISLARGSLGSTR